MRSSGRWGEGGERASELGNEAKQSRSSLMQRSAAGGGAARRITSTWIYSSLMEGGHVTFTLLVTGSSLDAQKRVTEEARFI